MEFFGTAFLLFAPILILYSLFVAKPRKYYVLNVLAIVNILLMGHSIHLIMQQIQLVKMAMQMNVKPPKNATIDFGWEQIKFLLIIFLPFLFIIKPIAYNRLLSVIMIFLLQYDNILYVVDCIKGKSNFYCSYYFEYHYVLKMMYFFSWFCVLYSFCWMINYLPFNIKKIKLKNNLLL